MTYSYIDMHCDTLLKAVMDGQLYNNPGNMLDVSRIVMAGQGAQFFAVFFPPPGLLNDAPSARPLPDDEALFETARQLLLNTAACYPDAIKIAYTANDIEQNIKSGHCSAILSIEDSRAACGDLTKFQRFFDLGVRAMSLTWNMDNCFGHPNSPDSVKMNKGLTDFGKAALIEMNRLGILIDVSHLSDGGFWDVEALSSAPFIATHSNCRALCDHPRNLSDGMIAALAAKGGVMGVNFAPEFLSVDGMHISTIDDICGHILHAINIGGEDCVGLGTDFDGIDGQFEIGQPTEMAKLFDALQQKGLSERQIDKFAAGNVLRVMRDVIK